MRFVECLYFAVSAGMNPIMIKVYARAFGLTGAPMDVARQNLSRELPTIFERAGVRAEVGLVEAALAALSELGPVHGGEYYELAAHTLGSSAAAARA